MNSRALLNHSRDSAPAPAASLTLLSLLTTYFVVVRASTLSSLALYITLSDLIRAYCIHTKCMP
ncbi:hypothetical protein GALMADRAFT_256256 [Galerina marginata CBS 339.88]|uniref:Uncharacterized protein n=1 Tax=Galerina marginata (strain CBS 339.88) TaxID=685588 RepID=A0A067SDQ7_GALM3|nr:hypothetical protein GALMADRAFT_256256 [Galerina marginata CBS 339.88]